MRPNHFFRRAVLSALLGVLAVAPAAVAQFPEVPPADVTRAMDRDQMMWQLGISFPEGLPPRIEDPNRPLNAWPQNENDPDGNWTDADRNTITRSGFGLWVTYDDDNPGVYTPIDLLKMKDGTVISTPEDWWSKRRPEIKKDVEELVWGVIPDASRLPAVTWNVETTRGGEGAGAYIEKSITGTIDTSRNPQVRDEPRIVATLRIPANADRPVPVIISFGGGVGNTWDLVSAEGWGVCAFNPGALQPDNGAGLTSYLIGLVNQGQWRKPSDWGTLVAWSWGVSRLIDYFETDDQVDATKIGVTGHSRYGKAAIVAMAYEPRLAIAYPSCGGALGPSMIRRHWGQNLENVSWEQEYHWVAGNAFRFMGPLNEGEYKPRKVELLPVDAHSLLALAAPRPVFLNGGTTDTWSDPYGTYLTGVGATPVYELLGKDGLIMDDAKPVPDVAYIEGAIGYRNHVGGHTPAPDWPAFIEFARRYLNAEPPETAVVATPAETTSVPSVESPSVPDRGSVESTAHRWVDLVAGPGETAVSRRIVSGDTTHLGQLEIVAEKLLPGSLPQAELDENHETLIILKEGRLKVTIGDQSRELGPSSIALVMPGDLHAVQSVGDAPATFYVLKYASRTGPAAVRAERGGGSMMIEWNDLPFEPHDRGGLRDFFDRGTAMTRNFEMHVTTLNEGLTSHPPHTHISEEIILMVSGEAEEYIDGSLYPIGAGDFVFLASQIPHNIRNIGVGTCTYFAFQWR